MASENLHFRTTKYTIHKITISRTDFSSHFKKVYILEVSATPLMECDRNSPHA